jgi:hypothetical protein
MYLVIRKFNHVTSVAEAAGPKGASARCSSNPPGSRATMFLMPVMV